ncbi:MAG: DUF1499 domain-containing protein [Woeseiaceae bacterium]
MSKNNVVNKIPRKPISKVALLGLTLAVVAVVTIAISVVGYRSGWWRHPQSFSLFGWATYAAIAALIVSAYGIFKTRIQNQQGGFLVAITALVLSLPIISATLMFEYSANAYPKINDISTDTLDPPSFWDVEEPMEYPGDSVAELQKAAYPDIVSLTLPITSEQAFEHALAIITDKGWEIVAKVPDEGRIEAVVSSLLYGFKDEIVVRIVSADDGVIVDVRSRSRIGRIDRGANAKRIRNYLKDLKARVI